MACYPIAQQAASQLGENYEKAVARFYTGVTVRESVATLSQPYGGILRRPQLAHSFGPKGQRSFQPWATPRERGEYLIFALNGQRS